MTTTTPDPAWWARLTPGQRDGITRVINRYADLLPSGYRTTTDPAPDWETFVTLTHWQALENEILENHTAWLERTRAMFKRNGWPWTTTELAARSHIREVGE